MSFLRTFGCSDRVEFPDLYLVKQEIDASRIEDVASVLNRKLEKSNLLSKVQAGQRVAITAGSRGVKDNPLVLRELASRFKALGAKPFIAPAMGSHGGATSEGQAEVLRNLGIEESTMGAPIVSSVDVVEIGRTRDDIPVLVGRDFAQAHHVVVVNRIKPHTDFIGEIESGLLKIMVIGMGKPGGAMLVHQSVVRHGFQKIVMEIGKIILQKLPILMGIGIIENQYCETAHLEVIKPGSLISEEKRLLKKAKKIVAQIPIEDVDLLIVDEMGKEISGSGMDTKVIGRIMNLVTPEPPKQRLKRIFVRDLTEESEGNACGIGLSDFTTERLVSKINKEVTKINSVLGGCPEKGRIPIAFDNDRDAITAGLINSGVHDFKKARLVWIKNTLELRYFKVSRALSQEVKANEKLRMVEGPSAFHFDGDGNLPFGTFPENKY
jgi:hypothetical protein